MRLPLAHHTPMLVAVFATLTLGCAANRPELTCPKSGGPAWTEVKSPHFVVQTDLSESAARQMAEDVEAARQALLAALGAPTDEGAAPVELIVFERDRDMTETTGQPNVKGYFTAHLASDLELQRVVVTAGGLDEETRLTLQHELTHEIVRRRTARVPWWLSEGLAETFSTVRVDGREIVVGEPPPRSDFWEESYSATDASLRVRKTFFSVGTAPSLDQLLGTDGRSFEKDDVAPIYYTAAWKLVHVLRGDTNPSWAPRFAEMMADLMKGKDGFEAFSHAYKGVTFSDIGSAYQASLVDHREHPSSVAYTAPPAPPLTARKLSDGEVHGLWARLSTERTGQQAAAQLAKGFEDDPESIELRYARASLFLAEKETPPPVEDIRFLRRKSPDDPRYLLLDLVRAMEPFYGGKEGSAASREEVLSLGARLREIGTSPAQRAMSLYALIVLGQYEEATLLGDKTVRADPSCGPCFTAYASALLQADRPGDALAAARSALALLHERERGAQWKLIQQIVARAEATLKKASAAPGP